MKAAVLLLLLGCVPAMFCFTLYFEEDDVEDWTDGVEEFNIFDENARFSDGVTMEKCQGRNCSCCKHGCVCSGRERQSNIPVRAIIMLADADPSSGPKISAKFKIGGRGRGLWFEDEFPFNRAEDVCRKLKGTEYCFKFEVKNKGDMLYGGVSLSKPQTLELGCFTLPL